VDFIPITTPGRSLREQHIVRPRDLDENHYQLELAAVIPRSKPSEFKGLCWPLTFHNWTGNESCLQSIIA